MPNLIKDGQIIADEWLLVSNPDSEEEPLDLPEGKIIVPLAIWQAHREALIQRGADVGVWLDSEETPDQLADETAQFPIIAVNFPSFMDGRGFSTARLLRERYQYQGELRAIGYILRDQLYYLKRCGFNAFSFSEDVDIEAALESLSDFSESYQAAVDEPRPLFRRRA